MNSGLLKNNNSISKIYIFEIQDSINKHHWTNKLKTFIVDIYMMYKKTLLMCTPPKKESKKSNKKELRSRLIAEILKLILHSAIWIYDEPHSNQYNKTIEETAYVKKRNSLEINFLVMLCKKTKKKQPSSFYGTVPFLMFVNINIQRKSI